jgi:hypothetical protein
MVEEITARMRCRIYILPKNSTSRYYESYDFQGSRNLQASEPNFYRL